MEKLLSVIVLVFSLGFIGSAYAVETTIETPQEEVISTININSADAASIASGLKGIGLKKAEAIIAFREANGPFKSIDELALVKGIGPKTVELNKANISLN